MDSRNIQFSLWFSFASTLYNTDFASSQISASLVDSGSCVPSIVVHLAGFFDGQQTVTVHPFDSIKIINKSLRES